MAEATPDTKPYILKEGCVHSAIVKGEMITAIGDGKATFDLTEGQAVAFKDKFSGVAEVAVDPVAMAMGGETPFAATATEAAAAESVAANPETADAPVAEAAEEAPAPAPAPAPAKK